MTTGGAAALFRRTVRAGERATVAAGLIVIVVCVLWSVVTRYISAVPSTWTGEAAAIAFCWMSLIGAASLYGTGEHPSIYDPKLIRTPVLRALVSRVGFLIQLAVLILVGVLSIVQIFMNIDNPTPVLEVPTAIYYVPLAWFGLSSTVRLLNSD